MKIKQSEKDLQKAIVDLINYRGGVAVKFNNWGFRKTDGSFIPPRELGVSDILACYKGCFLAFEVKSTGKKATLYQTAFIDRIKKSGGFAAVTDDLKEVEEVLNFIDREWENR